jgi:16S rRNA (guanine527-N7)-methyltransferase
VLVSTAGFGSVRPMTLHPDPAVDQKLASYAALVRASEHNLVSRRARDELETRHVPECVRLALMLPQGKQRLLDLGSGGGFPGMVLAIVRPELEVHLLDATAKKTAFLEQAAARLAVPVTVHTGRAEELAGSELGGTFDVVTARAVAPLERLVAWGMPFLVPGGLLCAVKGARWADELAAAAGAIARSGASVVATPDDVEEPPADGPQPRVVMLARVS